MSKIRPTIPIQPIDFDQAQRAVDTLATTRNMPSLAFPQAHDQQAVAQSPTTHRLNLEVTDHVMRALKQRALDGGITVRAIVLRALLAAGVPVANRDLQGDGRRAPKGRS